MTTILTDSDLLPPRPDSDPEKKGLVGRNPLEPYFSRTRGAIRPGAHRLQRLLENHISEGVLDLPCILVTGSNGKGTVCAFLESALRAQGLRTGLYTSPHLVSPSERIRISGRPIELEPLASVVQEVERASSSLLPDASFFEITTAAALLAFARSKIDVLIAEVGLGGRLDSTNALSPLVSVLTSVSLEHTDLLGATERDIAAEKAFVARRNRPLVTGPLSRESRDSVTSVQERIGFRWVDGTSADPLPPAVAALEKRLLEVPIDGASATDERQVETSSKAQSASQPSVRRQALRARAAWRSLNSQNLRLALRALLAFTAETGRKPSAIAIDPHAYPALSSPFDWGAAERGLARAFWPGRFDVRQLEGTPVIFDACHNSAGFRFFLSQYERSDFASLKPAVVFASLSDKDWPATLRLLGRMASFVVFSRASSDRAVAPGRLAQTWSAEFGDSVPFAVEDDPARAVARARGAGPVVLVTGSIAFLGETMEKLSLDVFPDDASAEPG